MIEAHGSVAADLIQRTATSRDHRCARCHRFEDRNAESLKARRLRENISGAIERWEVVRWNVIEDDQPISQAAQTLSDMAAGHLSWAGTWVSLVWLAGLTIFFLPLAVWASVRRS